MATLAAGAPRWVVIGLVGLVIGITNAVLGYGLAEGGRPALAVAALAVLPIALIAFGMLVQTHRATLAWIALALPFVGQRLATDALPLPGSVSVFPTDVLVLLAIGAWLASRLTGQETQKLSPTFRWPLVVLAIALLPGVLEGNEQYGTSLVSQPFRLVAYSGIALALVDATAAQAWRAITRVFYAGAIVQAGYGVYYLSTGQSQTTTELLSTGGLRYLSLSTALYLTGSLLCALVNLGRRQDARLQVVDAVVAGLALFGITIAFGRAVWLAAFVAVVALLASRPGVRRGLAQVIPLILPLVTLAALAVFLVYPGLVPTLEERIFRTSVTEQNVDWRAQAARAVLKESQEDRLFGVGFGKPFAFQSGVLQGDPHNGYVWLLAGGGAAALCAWLLIGITFVIDALRRLHQCVSVVDRTLITWSLATWFVFSLNAAAEPLLSDPIRLITLWVLMSLPMLVGVGDSRLSSDGKAAGTTGGTSSTPVRASQLDPGARTAGYR